MSDFVVLNQETAPDASRPLLDAVKGKFGLVPNLTGVLALAPSALGAYLAVTRELEGSSLTPVEQQVVLLATSVENSCEYCVSVHSAVANAVKMPTEALTALRQGHDPDDARLGALSSFARRVVAERGWVGEETVKEFLDAGFTRQQVLEVVTGVALKTLSNYANHIAGTPLDPAFETLRWTAAEVVAA